MVALGSVRLAGDIGRDGLGLLWKAFSAIVDPMGHQVREALHRLCVDDMWFAEGPDWLDRIINTARAARGEAVAGELRAGGGRRRLRLAVSALVALARGGARQAQARRSIRSRRIRNRPIVKSHRARRRSRRPMSTSATIDPRFFNEKGYMRPGARSPRSCAARIIGEEDEAA
jgi:hypothetical protein